MTDEDGGAVAEAAASGDTLKILIAMRDRIARSIDDPKTPARDLAALTKRLADTVREIKVLEEQQGGDSDDDDDEPDGDFDPASV